MGKIKLCYLGVGLLVGLLRGGWWKRNWIYGHCKGVFMVGQMEYDSFNPKKYTHNYIFIGWLGAKGLDAYSKVYLKRRLVFARGGCVILHIETQLTT